MYFLGLSVFFSSPSFGLYPIDQKKKLFSLMKITYVLVQKRKKDPLF